MSRDTYGAAAESPHANVYSLNVYTLTIFSGCNECMIAGFIGIKTGIPITMMYLSLGDSKKIITIGVVLLLSLCAYFREPPSASARSH